MAYEPQISVRLSDKERAYVDREIERGRFGSYGQAFRGLLYHYKQQKRTIARLMGETAVLRHENKRLKANGVDDN